MSWENRRRRIYQAFLAVVFLLGVLSLAYLTYLCIPRSGSMQKKGARTIECKVRKEHAVCDPKPRPLAMKRSCPEGKLMDETELDRYKLPIRVRSPVHCFANIRSDPTFDSRQPQNIMIELQHGQPLCARRRNTSWELLLQDPKGGHCRGYLALGLATCAPPPGIQKKVECEKDPFALPLNRTCPMPIKDRSVVLPLWEMQIRSTDSCYANIRSTGEFRQGYTDNILRQALHGQRFCGRGPLKYVDPKTGEKGAVYYLVLLKDPGNELCWGKISLSLADRIIAKK